MFLVIKWKITQHGKFRTFDNHMYAHMDKVTVLFITVSGNHGIFPSNNGKSNLCYLHGWRSVVIDIAEMARNSFKWSTMFGKCFEIYDFGMVRTEIKWPVKFTSLKWLTMHFMRINQEELLGLFGLNLNMH